MLIDFQYKQNPSLLFIQSFYGTSRTSSCHRSRPKCATFFEGIKIVSGSLACNKVVTSLAADSLDRDVSEETRVEIGIGYLGKKKRDREIA
jgi:hypothetical protein